MDINEYKKIAIPKIEVGKMVEIVRKVIKDEKDSRLDKYEEKKEVYKPITEKLEKEINEISNLREEYIKSVNKPITYIPQQQHQHALPNVEQVKKKVFDLDTGFTENDKDILYKYELPIPSILFAESINNDYIVKRVQSKSGKLIKQLNLARNHVPKTPINKLQNENKRKGYNNEILLIQKYKNRIKAFDEGKKLFQSGTGVYNQIKRNAYKINQTTGHYGNLKIDLPKLFGQLKMIAYKNGKKIYDKNVLIP